MKAPHLVAFSVFALSLCASAAEAAPTECPANYFQGEAPAFVNPKLANKAREVCFFEYGVMHSGVKRSPIWAAEHLTRNRLIQANAVARVDEFHAEPRLPPDERSELAQFAKSGFDRGHIAPAADFASVEGQRESFSLANMVPQNPNNNRGLWSDIEAATRYLTKSMGELYVISGPAYQGTTLKQLNGGPLVPTHLFKLLINPKTRQASAYWVENKATQEYRVMTVAELEALTGINFLPTFRMEEKQTKWELPAPKGNDRKPRGAAEAARSADPQGEASKLLSEMVTRTRQAKHLLQYLPH